MTGASGRLLLFLEEPFHQGGGDGRLAAAVAGAGEVGLDGAARARAHQPVARAGLVAPFVEALLPEHHGRPIGQAGAGARRDGAGLTLAAGDLYRRHLAGYRAAPPPPLHLPWVAET